MASHSIENTFNLIQIAHKTAVVCLCHFIVYFMNHKHYTASPIKALGNYPETAILLLVTFTETTVHLVGKIEC